MTQALEKVKDEVLANIESVGALTSSIIEGLGGESLTPLDLTNVGMPTGGSTYWSVPTLEKPDGEAREIITGVVIHQQMSRKFWEESFEDTDSGQRPDCNSDDAIIGIGTPGGECGKCEKAEWGSGRGNAQACTLNKNLFVLTGSELLPIRIALTPGSLPAAKKFVLRVASSGEHFSNMLVDIGLKKAQSRDGKFTYSQATFTVRRKLTDKESVKVQEYKESIIDALAAPRQE